MPSRFEWLSRIKVIEREYSAAEQSVDYFSRAVASDANILRKNLRHRDITAAAANLEGTYVIRLFAEFETGARQCWTTAWKTEPGMKDLLEGLAARCGIPNEQLLNAHGVRKYRNALVHEREDESVEVVAISEVRSRLCRFFSFLPAQW